MAVIECGGVGFKCLTTLVTQRNLPPLGSQAMLYTYLSVREDAMDLFGFATMQELNCFRMLTSVSGVGAKVGLSILSELTPEQVAMAAASGDSKTLTRCAGVGTKLAQRIVLELQDKVKKEFGSGAKGMDLGIGAAGIVSASSHAAEAVSALSVLGYAPTDAASVVAKFDRSALDIVPCTMIAFAISAPFLLLGLCPKPRQGASRPLDPELGSKLPRPQHISDVCRK